MSTETWSLYLAEKLQEFYTFSTSVSYGLLAKVSRFFFNGEQVFIWSYHVDEIMSDSYKKRQSD